MNRIFIPFGIKNAISAAPDILMALTFLVIWFQPSVFGNGMMKYLSLIILLEFITIHSAGFLGFVIVTGKTKFQKISRVIVLGIFYSFFIFSLLSPTGEFWPLGAFWLLLLNRILGVLLSDVSAVTFQIDLFVRWAWSAFCYVVSIVISIKIPMPQFGWNEASAQQFGPGGAGLWFEQPHTLLAAGFLYFLLVSIFEIYSHRITGKFADINPKISLFRER